MLSPEFTRIFGQSPTDGPEDPFHLAANAKPQEAPRDPDRLRRGGPVPRPEPRVPRAPERARRSPTSTRNTPGTHAWHYWDRHVREAIDFHRRNLDIPDDLEHALLR